MLRITIIVLFAMPVQAATIFTNEDDFLAASNITTLESYETLSVTTRTNEIITDHFVVSTESLTQAAATIYIRDEDSAGGLRPTHGQKYLVMGHSPGSPIEEASRLTFDFNQPITSLGMSVVDFGDFGTGTLSFNNDLGDQFIIATAPLPDGNELFFGIIADQPFSQVVIDKMTSADGIGIDEMYFTIVPEPSTLALLLIGLLPISLLLKHRRGRSYEKT